MPYARWLLALVLVVTGCLDTTTPVDPSDTDEVLFEVPPGTPARRLGGALEQTGLIRSRWVWTWFFKVQGADGRCVKAGEFYLRKSMTPAQVLATLCGPPLSDDVPFAVLEGWRIVDIDRALAAKGLIQPGDYRVLAESKAVPAPFEVTGPSYEGYLYPETYHIPPEAKRFRPAELIARQLAMFKARFFDVYSEQLGKRTLEQVVVMASMIEREEPSLANRPVVAGILWKRLDHGWQLGVDATSRYRLDDWGDERAFLQKLADPTDPYNTRVHKGLPPTAIGNPTQSALEAAANPVDSDYWFYLHDRQGVFHGGRDGAHHERNRATYNVY